jgi:hypothetical protein
VELAAGLLLGFVLFGFFGFFFVAVVAFAHTTLFLFFGRTLLG